VVQGAHRADRAPEFTSCSASFEAELDYVLRTLRRHGVSPRDAEDLAQDVFLVMWRRWGDFDPTRPLRAWLAGIAFKVAHEHHKRSSRWWPRETLDPRDERPLPDEQVVSAYNRRLVLGALRRLSERQRAILVMHELDELPMPEIAALMEVPLFTGYSRLRLARKAFARAVEKQRVHMPDPQEAALPPPALLDVEREAPPVAPSARKRVVSRMRAALAHPPAPRPAPRLPASRAPWLVAAAAAGALIAVAVGRGAGERWPALAVSPGAPSPAKVVAVVPARGLVGYWKFDEAPGSTQARDHSGHGNDCLVRSAGGQAVFGAGRLGGAVALDGRGWLECPRPQALARLDRALSISVWVKPMSTVGGRQALVARQLGQENQDYFLLALNGDTLEVQSDLWASATKRRVPRPAGHWFHVAAVQGADGRRTLYLDGEEIGRSNKSRPVALGGGSNPLTIGGAINGPAPRAANERFQGQLDELALFARPLGEGEVRALAAGAQPSP